MSDFDPGPGWKRVGPNEVEPTDETILHRPAGGIGLPEQWVREVPVPALPTAPYTVIRVIRAGSTNIDYCLSTGMLWRALPPNQHGPFSSSELAERIANFEVLSEPRAVTTKAVLEYLQPVLPGNWARDCASTFGVVDLYVAADSPPEFEAGS